MVFSESQQKVLETLYEKGMTSKGKDSLALRQKAVEETGADMSSVVNWIGNYKKKLFGKQREKSKITHTKGPSGYNIFVQENKDSLPAFAEWGSKWKSLTVEKQEEYKNKAASYKRHPQKDEKHEKMFLKKLRELLAEMLSVGLDFAAVGTKINGHYVVVGDGKTADLLLVNNDLATKIAGQEFETDERGNVKELRKKAQEHMNKLYANAINKPYPFPYKKVRNQEIQILGLPEEILPIRPMSDYGEKKLRAILETKEITVEHQDTSNDLETNTVDYAVSSEMPADTNAQQLNIPVIQDAVPGPSDLETNTVDYAVSSEMPADTKAQQLNIPVIQDAVPGPSGISTLCPLEDLSFLIEENGESPVVSLSQKSLVTEPLYEEIKRCKEKGEDLQILGQLSKSRKGGRKGVSKQDCRKVKNSEGNRKKTEEESLTHNNPGAKRKRTEEKTLTSKNPEVYQVESIVSKKKKGKKTFVLVKWLGYPEEENTWEPEENLLKLGHDMF